MTSEKDSASIRVMTYLSNTVHTLHSLCNRFPQQRQCLFSSMWPAQRSKRQCGNVLVQPIFYSIEPIVTDAQNPRTTASDVVAFTLIGL